MSSKEVQKLKKRNLQLEEENNLLKLKIELLLDMVSLLSAYSCTQSTIDLIQLIFNNNDGFIPFDAISLKCNG